MTPASEAGSEVQRLAQFQLTGNAAERYERWVVPFVVGPWVPRLLDLADLRPGERVLDVATGTGVVGGGGGGGGEGGKKRRGWGGDRHRCRGAPRGAPTDPRRRCYRP
jgi:hypothetical protein